jgi:hypothetical protein
VGRAGEERGDAGRSCRGYVCVFVCYTHYDINPEGKEPNSADAVAVLLAGDEGQWEASLLATQVLKHETFCKSPTIDPRRISIVLQPPTLA